MSDYAGSPAFRRTLLWVLTIASGTALAFPTQSVAQDAKESEPPAAADQDQPSSKADRKALHFRRLFVPHDRPASQWPLPNVPYLPVDAKLFEHWVETLRNITGPEAVSATARIERATYTARLEGDRLLAGRATLEIKHPADLAPPPASRVPLLLTPCNLAVIQAAWAGEESEPIALGAGQDGQLVARLRRSGRLQLDWTLRGRAEAAGAVNFVLELPRSPTTTLVLALPSGMAPLPSHGVVAEEPTDDGALRLWRIEIGGRTSLQLRLQREVDVARRRPVALVRQVTTYKLSTRGVEVDAEVTLDVHHEPLEQVELEFDQPLQLLGARLGDTELSSRVVSTNPDGPTRVAMQLPQPVLGTGRVLQITAWAPLVEPDRWRLPSVRPRGTNVFWHEGRATLLVPEPLELREMTTTGCRQSRVGRLPDPASGELVELQYFQPDASIEVVVGRRDERSDVLLGTTVEINQDQLHAQVRAQIRQPAGIRFELEAELAPRWIVDSLRSDPPDAVEDWKLVDRAGGGRAIRVDLAEPLRQGEALQLQISGRRLREPESTWKLAALEMLRFDIAQSSRRWLCVRSRVRDRLKLSNEGALAQLELTRDLDAAPAALLDRPEDGVVFAMNPETERMRVKLEPRRPVYRAEIEVAASLDSQRLRESYVLRCDRTSAAVDRLTVYFSEPRDEPPRWTLYNPEGQPDSDHKLTAILVDEPGDASTTAGQTWRIELHPPIEESFEIRAARTCPLISAKSLSLVSLPEAIAQSGYLKILTHESPPLVVQTRRLKPVPIAIQPAPDRERSEAVEHGPTNLPGTDDTTREDVPTRLRYRYHPASDLDPALPPAAALVACNRADYPSEALVWHAQLDSRYESDGKSHHLAQYHVQNFGRSRLAFTLPMNCEAVGVWVDGLLVPRSISGMTLSVDLPSNDSFVRVAVQFVLPGRRLSLWSHVACSLPKLDAPIVAGRWSLWLPPGYEAGDLATAGSATGASSADWARRWFGPLARSRATRPFDPFSSGDWLRLFTTTPEEKSAASCARQMLEWLGTSDTPEATGGAENMTWGQMAARLDKSLGSLGRRLLVDQPALSGIGLLPDEPVRNVNAETPQAQGRSLMERSGLALLIHPRAVVLTSARRTAQLTEQLEHLSGMSLYRTLPGPLAERLDSESSESVDKSGYMSVAVWQSLPAAAWRIAGSSTSGEDEFWIGESVGWNAREFELPDAGDARVRVVNRTLIRVLSWSTLLLVASLAWWRARGRPIVLIVAAGALAAVALVVPLPLAPLASCGLLGILVCLGLELLGLRKAQTILKPPTPESTQLHRPLATVSVLVGTAALLLAVAAQAQESGPTAVPNAAPVHHIFIPVDEKGTVTGQRYSVPVSFYQELRRRFARVTRPSGAWLLERANYRCQLVREDTPRRLALEGIKATLDVRVVEAGDRLRLPLNRAEVNLKPDDVFVEGEMVPFEWSDDGKFLEVDLARPGTYRLEIVLRPASQTSGNATFVDVAVPQLATATLEMQLPPGEPSVQVPTARGAVTLSDDGRRLRSQLGPTDRLMIEWHEGSAVSSDASVVDVEELLWLDISSGSVVLRAKAKFTVKQGSLQTVRIASDSRLSLLPMQGQKQPIDDIDLLPGEPQTIEFELSRAVTDKIELATTHLLTGTSGVGHLRVPELRVLDARSTRRLLAITVDPALQWKVNGPERLPPVAPDAFAEAWGAEAKLPALAFELPKDAPMWSLATQPHRPLLEARQHLTLGVGQQRSRASFRAEVTSADDSGFALFQHRIAVPRELEIDQLSIRVGNVDRAARWIRDNQGSITVFLNQSAAGPHHISLAGWLPTPSDGRLTVPPLNVLACQTVDAAVEIYRQPSVLIEIADLQGFEVADPPAPRAARLDEADESAAQDNDDSPGRLVARLVATDVDANVVVHVRPNEPSSRVAQVTTLRRGRATWQAEVDYHLEVTSGLVDTIQFDLPEAWNPSEFQPWPLELRIVELPHSSRRRLIIQPAKPVDQVFHLTMTGPVDVKQGETVRVPRIVPLSVNQVDHRLVLPTQLGAEQVAWETRGTLAAPPIESGREIAPVSEAVEVYRVVSDDFSARMRFVDRTPGEPLVRLADIRIGWQTDGRCRGIALFDIVPSGQVDCPLQVPSTCELVVAFIDGHRATLLPDGDAPSETKTNDDQPSNPPVHWRVALTSDRLPQQIAVLFAGRLPEPPNHRGTRVQAPSLGLLRVQRTVWTLHAPASAPLAEPEGSNFITPLQREALRHKSVSGLLSLAPNLARDETTEEVSSWYEGWNRQLRSTRGELERQLEAAPEEVRRRIEAETETMDSDEQRIAEELQVATEWQAGIGSKLVASGPLELWQGSTTSRNNEVVCMFPGGVQAIRLMSPSPLGSPLAWRLLGAALLGTLAGWAAWRFRHDGVPDQLGRWPHAAGVLVGLAWWLWLSPSALGLLIVVASLVSAARPGWRQRSEPGSTIVSQSFSHH